MLHRYVYKNGDVLVQPGGEAWHYDLWQQMGLPDESRDKWSAGYYDSDNDSISENDGNYKPELMPHPDEVHKAIREYLYGSHPRIQATIYNPFHFILHQDALHKFVWADGELRVTPNIAQDPGIMHHGDLIDQMGYGDPRSPMPQAVIAGEYLSPFDNLEIEYHRGNVPDEESLKEMIMQKIMPDHTGSYFLETIVVSPNDILKFLWERNHGIQLWDWRNEDYHHINALEDMGYDPEGRWNHIPYHYCGGLYYLDDGTVQITEENGEHPDEDELSYLIGQEIGPGPHSTLGRLAAHPAPEIIHINERIELTHPLDAPTPGHKWLYNPKDNKLYLFEDAFHFDILNHLTNQAFNDRDYDQWIAGEIEEWPSFSNWMVYPEYEPLGENEEYSWLDPVIRQALGKSAKIHTPKRHEASQGDVQKYIWYDGKFTVTAPQYVDDPPYHADMLEDMKYSWREETPNLSLGYYYPDSDSISPYDQQGDIPTEPELKKLIKKFPEGNRSG